MCLLSVTCCCIFGCILLIALAAIAIVWIDRSYRYKTEIEMEEERLEVEKRRLDIQEKRMQEQEKRMQEQEENLAWKDTAQQLNKAFEEKIKATCKALAETDVAKNKSDIEK